MNDHLDWNRIVHLSRLDLVRNFRLILIVAGGIAAVMIVQAILQPFAEDRTAVYLGFLAIICFIGGPVVASRSFAELHDKKQNEAYLLLPASAAEKVITRLLLVTVCFLPAAVLLVTAAAWIIYASKAVLLGRLEVLFLPTAALDVRLIGMFIMHQSIFFLGAAWFRKHHFAKTGLAVAVGMIALTWFFVLVSRFVLPDLGATLASIEFNPAPLFIELARSYAAIDWLVGLLIYVVVPGFCWTVAWLRVRETQVSHGI